MASKHKDTSGSHTGESEQSGEGDALVTALDEARRSPGDEAAWDQVEILAATLQRPDEVAALYQEVLERDLPPVLAASLGKRGAKFCEEWYGESSPALLTILTRVVALDPGAEWAFQRLTVAHTVAARWDDLLALYDIAIKGALDAERRVALLTEAANVARDFAQYPDRAIGYLETLVAARPDDQELSDSLERLLERQERWQGLIEFWSRRLDTLPRVEAQAARLRIAECYLDRLSRPEAALEQAQGLLQEGADDGQVVRLLERIAELEAAQAPVRQAALTTLKDHYDGQGKPADVVRTLDAALKLADRAQSVALHEELGSRLMAQGLNVEAAGHFAALICLEPSSRAALEQLRDLVKQTGDHKGFAAALEAAAGPCEVVETRAALRLEAAATRAAALGDRDGAIGLYRQVLDEPGLPAQASLEASRRVVELLGEAGRREEQLEALERQATLEAEPAVRMTVVGRAARLADELGQTGKALELWQSRVEKNHADVEALDAVVAILEREERWDALIGALRQRAGAAVAAHQQRVDSIRVARIQEEKLGDLAGAIATWREVQERFGRDAETVDALSGLLARTSRWDELAELLDEAAARESQHVADMLAWLGDAFRQEMNDPARALGYYLRAQRVAPTHERTFAGLTALLEDERCRFQAATALGDAYEAADLWSKALTLLDYQLAGARDDAHRVRLLRGAARTQEQRAGEPAAALRSLARAMPLAPLDEEIEAEALRLAEATGAWSQLAEAYHLAADGAKDLSRQLHLRFQEGTIAETRLDDAETALRAYAAVLKRATDRQDAALGMARAAGKLGQWDRLAAAVVTSSKARKELAPALVEAMERAAEAAGAWSELAAALEDAVTAAAEMPAAVGRGLDRLLARWHEQKRGDAVAAEAALRRAAAREGEDLDTLRELARLQRPSPGRDLFDTLVRISNLVLVQDDLDPLYEAARLSLDPIGEPTISGPTLERLYREAAGLWRGGRRASGKLTPEGVARWALEELIRLREEAGDHEGTVALLAQGGQLPLAPAAWREMRKRAARLCAGPIGDRGRAITLYRSILDETPDDAEVLRELGEVCEAEGRLPELLALRKQELELGADADRALVLRLDIARLVGEIAARGGRLDALKANLAQKPGHADTIQALIGMLEEARRYDDLTDLLEEQATKLGEADQGEKAASLWAKVASLSEERLHDIDRAIRAHAQVAEQVGSLESLDALARLHEGRGEFAAAARWLARRLEGTALGADRVAVAMRLARTRLAAGQRDRAIACLEAAIAEAPGATEIRDVLAQQYRETEAWAPLARLLTEAAQHIDDTATLLAFAREAATLFGRLGSPDRAIEVLRRASKAVPEDQEIRGKLADGLLAAGQLDEGEVVLSGLIESFGRRRTPERAALHYKLAQVKKGQGNLEAALEQLELASTMAVGDTRIMGMLAHLSREAGQHDRAERTYRALLMVVRRQAPEAEDAVGQSEVLYELHRLAKERGKEDEELLRLALQAVTASQAETKRFRKAMLARGEHELLLGALDGRAAAAGGAELAEVLAFKAEVLAAHLGRPEEALETSFKALEEAPDAWALHDSTRALAARLGQTKRYVEVLRDRIERTRRKSDATVATSLLERLGAILEDDLKDLDGAAEAYSSMEAWGERPAEARVALARVTLAKGDADEAMRLLERVARDDAAPAAARADARYRLAQVQLGLPALRAEGLDNLRAALKTDSCYERAGTILKGVTDAARDDATVLAFYRDVAKASEEPGLVLDYHRKRAACPDVTLAELREAVNAATKHEAVTTVDALLERAIEIAEGTSEGLASALWAPVALAQRRRASGDAASAAHWLKRAAEATPDQARAAELWLELADLAVSQGDLAGAVAGYERLLAPNPGNRKVWEPLLTVIATSGDEAKLVEVVGTVAAALPDEAARNEVRLHHARFLCGLEGREPDAANVLRTVLATDRANAEAATLLSSLFERTGYDEDLASLLAEQLEAAYAAGDAAAQRDLALRLGRLLERVRLEDAKNIYRRALTKQPEERSLIDALLGILGDDDDPRERVELLERPLAQETGEVAATLALRLADEWSGLGDDAAVARVLNTGYRIYPDHDALRSRLERWYQQRAEWRPLAELLTSEAARLASPGVSVALLRNAAALYLDSLADPAAAAAALAAARVYSPTDLPLLEELVTVRSRADQYGTAIEEVSAALDAIAGEDRVRMLRLRATLRLALAHTAEAVADLEEAYAIAGASLEDELIAALELRREHLSQTGDTEAERLATLRLAEVLKSKGDNARTRTVLDGWLGRAPQDLEALYLLRGLDMAEESWAAVAATCSRLVELERGAAQVDAVLRLVETCERLGQPEAARAGLERVHQDQPESVEVRDLLWKLYETVGATKELASMLIIDALRVEDLSERFALLRRSGELYLQSPDGTAMAIEPLEEALRLDPMSHETMVLLADAYIATGTLDKASVLLTNAIDTLKRRGPQLADLQHRMARLMAAEGNKDGQLQWLNAALETNKRDGIIAAELAELAMDVGDHTTAQKALRVVTVSRRESPMSLATAFLYQAKIAAAKGEKRQAQMWARRALTEEPDHQAAAEYLRELEEGS